VVGGDGRRLPPDGGRTVEAARLACGLRHDDRAQGPRSAQSQDVSATLPGLRSTSWLTSAAVCHHAFANHGEGFCPFNDVAVAVRVLQSRGIERAAIVDLDVHHGNGTAFIFESDPRVFTFSMHQQHNYPMWKPRGSLDIGLPDGAGDARVLSELSRALPMVMASEPQCVFYLAARTRTKTISWEGYA